MRIINKKILIPLFALAVVGVSVLGATSALASTTSNTESTIVQKIADKFGLNKDEVQKVFDQERADRKSQMEQKFEDNLTSLVNDGKITDAKKTLILNKHKELEAQKGSQKSDFKNLTPEERKSQMDAKKTELENWAKENGIDLKYLFGGFGGGMRGHRPMM